ncbi:cytochrome P450 oxidoreductase OrdA-like protein [Xylariaceae sp. FL0016]|nr:cytochrome P450 oxidoreductase OrdA-like protein [Xylariaceae sp. FL0016]
MIDSPQWLNWALALVVLFGAVSLLTPKSKLKAPLPPGPKPLPLIGNIRDLPPAGAREWEHWLKHKELYGPISSVSMMGTTMVIVNDLRLATELMEKRGNIYSSRPRMTFGMILCGWENFLASQPYSQRLRSYRRVIHKFVGTPAAMQRYQGLQEVEVHRFLLRTLEKPKDLVQHIRTEAGAIILKMAYGYTVEANGPDPLIDLADEALAQFSAATVPGTWLVDTIPALRHVPGWVPGAGFQRTAKEWYATAAETVERPMKFVRMQMASKEYVPSYVSDLCEEADGKMTEEDEWVAKYSAASLYTGGADTSVSTMETFFLSMTMHPEIQEKAREEIDRVIGTSRLPNLQDRDKLPYVEAVVKEAYRWHPIAPMGLPHVATEDDICEGYLIPKDALILPNIWLFAHDPEVYQDPMSFNPDRFLGSNPAPHPYDFVFGFGRRVCPGRLLADTSVWLTVARSLAALNIRKAVTSNGIEIEPEVQFTGGIISHPLPFEARIEARSPKHEDLIRRVEREHPWEKSDAEIIERIKA